MPMATVSSGSTSVVTPTGRGMSATRSESPIMRAEMSTSSSFGMLSGAALTVRLKRFWSTMPSASVTALASPIITRGTSTVTSWSGSIRRKSTWVTSRRTG